MHVVPEAVEYALVRRGLEFGLELGELLVHDAWLAGGHAQAVARRVLDGLLVLVLLAGDEESVPAQEAAARVPRAARMRGDPARTGDSIVSYLTILSAS